MGRDDSPGVTWRRNYLRDRYNAVTEALDEYKREHPCTRCGETDVRVLVFHHRDPEEKSFAVSSSLYKPWPVIAAEMLKCDVVCANCHAIIEWEKRHG